MADDQEKIVIICTHSFDDPEKAGTAFVMANGAMAMDVEACIVLQGNGVYLAKKGYVETMPKPGGFDRMEKLIADFRELGGSLRICVPCIRERNIDVSELIEGAETTAAARVITEVLKADAVLNY